MTKYNVSLTSEQLKGLLTNDEGLKGLIETTINQVLDMQMSEGYQRDAMNIIASVRVIVTATGPGQFMHALASLPCVYLKAEMEDSALNYSAVINDQNRHWYCL